MKTFRLFISLFLLLFPSHLVFASDNLDKQEEALNVISKFANDICGEHEDFGETSSTKLEGKVNAEIEGLLKKLAGLGISGTAAFENESYRGVLQKDLASLLKDKIKCRTMVMMEFKHLVPVGEIPSTPSIKQTISGKWNSFFGPTIFSQDGKNISGTLYYSDPQLEAIGATANIRGELVANTLTFVWWVFGDTPENPTGKGVLTLSDDANMLRGHFTNKNHPGDSAIWQLTRKNI